MGFIETLFKYPPALYRDGSLVFTSRVPVEVWLLLLVVLAGAAWYLYTKASRRLAKRAHRILFGLRTATFSILIFILAIPALRLIQPRARAVFTPVLVDTSRSMSIQDVDDGGKLLSRIEAAQAALGGAGGLGRKGLLRELSAFSTVLLYQFDSGATRAPDAGALQPTGIYTNVFRSVRDIQAELRAVPLAGVVMFTDGCRNTGGSTSDAAKLLAARGARLHVVGLGNPTPPKDYEVMRLYAPRTVRRNSEVELHATVRHTGFSNRPFEVRVTRGDETLLTKEIQPAVGTDVKRIRLLFSPDHAGTATYKLEIPRSRFCIVLPK